jgi:hypothetical protein
MANMSYCRFENTFNDLQDCHDEMCNGGVEENLSRTESRSFAELVELCRQIAETYEDVNYDELKEMSREK